MLKHCVAAKSESWSRLSLSSASTPLSAMSSGSVFDFEARNYENLPPLPSLLPDLLATSPPHERCSPHCLCQGTKARPPMTPALQRSKVTDRTDRVTEKVTTKPHKTFLPDTQDFTEMNQKQSWFSDFWSKLTGRPVEERENEKVTKTGLFARSKVNPSLIPEPVTSALKPKESIDRSRAITFERKMPRNLCKNCTCNLDPVSLSRNSGYENAAFSDFRRNSSESERENSVFEPESIDFCLPNENPYVNADPRIFERRADTRNKLNLRINTPYSYDPIYDVIGHSPALAKLRELAFTYPPLPARPAEEAGPSGKEKRRRRVLIAIIVILLITVLVIVVSNVLVAHFLISQSAQSSHSQNSTVENQSTKDSRQPLKLQNTVSDLSQREKKLPKTTTLTFYETRTTSSIPRSRNVTTVTVQTTQQAFSTTVQPFPASTTIRNDATSKPAISEVTAKVKLITGTPEPPYSTQGYNFVTKVLETSSVSLTTLTQTSESSTIATSTPTIENLGTLPRSKTTPKPHPTWLPEFDDDVQCEPNQFRCRSGVSRLPCLYPWEKCDGIQDCSDGSDEEFCDVLECYGNFKCADGQCVSLAKVCNGLADCADGSDEKNCSSFTCQSYEYRCPSGYCIPTQWVCDGEADCPDHREEFNCSRTCSAEKFLCREGWCITKEWRCNGIPDCAGGEDEEGCACATDEFKCETGGCTSISQVCDGVQQCRDGSDEWQCVNLAEDGTLLIRKTLIGDFLPVCADTWNGNFSDLTCRQLGYSGAARSEAMPFQAEAVPEMFSVSPSFNSFGTLTLQALVDRRSSSSCPSKVTLHCTPHSCASISPPQRSEVNRSKRSRVKRIVGGSLATSHEFPSVGILYHHAKKWACTATLLAPGWVVTSALCVRRTDPLPFDWQFVIGTAELSNPTNDLSMRTVRSFLRHPSYKFQTQLADHDLMLVQLDHPLSISEEIQVACLPDQPTPVGSRCFSAGWGYAMPGGFYINKVLKHLRLSTTSREECNSTRHYRGAITERMLCATPDEEGEGMCFNDEGSPLFCLNPKNNHWSLSGVLSSQSCGSHAPHPSVFAELWSMRRWIANTIGMLH